MNRHFHGKNALHGMTICILALLLGGMAARLLVPVMGDAGVILMAGPFIILYFVCYYVSSRAEKFIKNENKNIEQPLSPTSDKGKKVP